MLLSVDCFRKNRPEDAEIPILGPGGQFESQWIHLADLKGNIQAYPESDETFPRLKSQQRSVVQQLMASSDPLIQQALADPANIGFIKGVLGLADLVVPGEDSRNKQLREIDTLLKSAPIAMKGEAGVVRTVGARFTVNAHRERHAVPLHEDSRSGGTDDASDSSGGELQMVGDRRGQAGELRQRSKRRQDESCPTATFRSS